MAEPARTPAEDSFVVGIGASAGGLAALKSFFADVPADTGFAYVVVVHLSAGHETHLPDLLQPYVKMPVRQVVETVRLDPDQVYIIPPDRNLHAIDTHLRLAELDNARRERAPIDHFFRILAESHGGRAVGVVLTGTGCDGTVGLREIKGRHGLTIVQDPIEAEYDSMPQSAIASGMVDLILPAGQIARSILDVMRSRPHVATGTEPEELADLQSLMAATHIATLFVDRERRILRFTPQVMELFNLRPTDRGRPLSDITHRLGWDNLAADVVAVLASLVPLEHEIMDDRGRCFLARVGPYRSADDRIAGVVLTFVDITALKRSQQALRESEEKYRTLFDSIAAGFFVAAVDLDAPGVGAEVRLLEANPAFHVQMQLPDVVGRSLRELFPGDEAFWRGTLAQVAADGSPRRFLRQIGSSGGSWYDVLAYRADGAGAPRVAILLNDVTELRALTKSLEERVRERTREVRQLASQLSFAEQEERSRISQVLHDDLQQLLYGIQMKISSAVETVDAGDPVNLANQLVQTSEWVRQAFETTRRLTVELNPPVLRDESLGESLYWLQSHMHEMYGLAVELTRVDDCRIPDEGVRRLLFHVIRELLFNVVKHARTDRARLRLNQRGDEIRLEVADDGDGADGPALTGGGRGLRSIQERLRFIGGELSIDTAPRKGTRAVVVVPATVIGGGATEF